MQVIGLAPAFIAIEVIATRSTRQSVTEWADRVVRRHVRRTPALHRPLTTEKAIVAAATTDDLSPEVVKRIVAAFRDGEEIFAPDKGQIREFVVRGLDTMDFMESLPMSDRRIRRIERLSWADAEQMSADWHASLARVRAKSKDVMAGVRKIAELDDGSFFAELTTAQALRTEGSEMGHCVGGYWSRVKGGDTRIISLRDRDGHPHVTIELSRPAEVHVEGRGNVRLMSNLRAGMNQVMTSVDWYAAQIRGKQNRMPVDKYADKVRRWLRDASIASREEGFAVNASSTAMAIYAVPEGKGYFLTEDADSAFTAASNLALRQLTSGKTSPKGLLQSLRIDEIVRSASNDAAVAKFAHSFVDTFQSTIEHRYKKDGGDVLRMLAESGIDRFMRDCFIGRSLGFDPMGKLRDFLFDLDSQSEGYTADHVITSVPNGSKLTARIHTISTLGLAMLNAGRAQGFEERILNQLEPKLRRVVTSMKEEKGVYHVIRPSASAVKRNDIVQALFACGMGHDYAVAAAHAASTLRMSVKGMALEAKKARLAGENANVVLNLLSEGYETRLARMLCEQFGSECVVIGPEPQKPVAMHNTASLPIAKSYPVPRR
jgi:hypothetical protein